MIAVCGGRQARPAGVADRRHRALYDQGVLLWLDPDTGALTPGRTAPGRLGAPSLAGGELVLCTERSVLRGAEEISRPWMADVHHALVHEGRLWAVCTAIDALVSDEEWLPVDPQARRPAGDVRDVALPRARSHPNHALAWDGALWVTRGLRGDVVSTDGRRWPLTDGIVVHDGVAADDGIWFTAVDGRLLRVDPAEGRVDRVVDLRQPDDGPEPLGWCRGICLRGDLVWVAFTRIRTTAWRARLAWTRGLLRGRPVATRRPTRVAAFERATGRRVREIPTEGLDAIFGMCAVE